MRNRHYLHRPLDATSDRQGWRAEPDYAPPVEPTGWARRLDERADRALKRRFGFGLTGSEELTLRKHLIIAVVGSLAVAVVIFIALVTAGEAQRGWTLLGPVIGVPLGVAIGHWIRDSRKRK